MSKDYPELMWRSFYCCIICCVLSGICAGTVIYMRSDACDEGWCDQFYTSLLLFVLLIFLIGMVIFGFSFLGILIYVCVEERSSCFADDCCDCLDIKGCKNSCQECFQWCCKTKSRSGSIHPKISTSAINHTASPATPLGSTGIAQHPTSPSIIPATRSATIAQLTTAPSTIPYPRSTTFAQRKTAPSAIPYPRSTTFAQGTICTALSVLTSSEELKDHILPLKADSTPWTIISDLITHTWVTNKQGTMPSSNNTPITITSILHVFNVKTIGPYKENNIITAEAVTENDFDRSKILTFQFQQRNEKDAGIEGYQKDEVHLFHGTSVQNMLSIMKNGFNLAKASSRSLYGRAIYLSDSAEKANQYTSKYGGFKKSDLILILARAKVGRMYKHTTAGEPTKEKIQGYDSIVVDRPTSNFKEFLIYDGSRILPEYVIIYDKVRIQTN